MTRDSERVRIERERVLSDDHYLLKKTTFSYRRSDGEWQRQSRETYDRGNGATILLYNRERGTVVLTRQFRYPAYVNGSEDGMLIEACAGLLDEDDPETAIRREAEEETGYRVGEVQPLFTAYTSPGAVTEQLHFFAAEYTADARHGEGGGAVGETEDIEVLELPFAEALRMIGTGEIADVKTIALLLWAQANGVLDRGAD